MKPWQPTRDRAVKFPRGCHRAGQLTQPRKQSRKYGTCKCNFPLLHKCCDKSRTALYHGLIAVKSFDVPSANQSKQITESLSCKAAHQKFILHSRSETNVHGFPPVSENTLVLRIQLWDRHFYCFTHCTQVKGMKKKFTQQAPQMTLRQLLSLEGI